MADCITIFVDFLFSMHLFVLLVIEYGCVQLMSDLISWPPPTPPPARAAATLVRTSSSSSSSSSLHKPPGAHFKALEAAVLAMGAKASTLTRAAGRNVKHQQPFPRLCLQNGSPRSSNSLTTTSFSEDLIGTQFTSALVKSINMGDSHRLVSQLKQMIST